MAHIRVSDRSYFPRLASLRHISEILISALHKMVDREHPALTSHRNTHKPGLFGPKDFHANCRIQLVTFSTSDEQKTGKNHLETINRAGSVSRSLLRQSQLSAERSPPGPWPLPPREDSGCSHTTSPGSGAPRASETASLLSSRALQAADTRGATKQEEKGRRSVRPLGLGGERRAGLCAAARPRGP